MKIFLKDVANLRNLHGVLKNQTLPIRLAYKFSKIFKKAEEENAFYVENLTKIINKYSEKDENGNPIILPNQNIKVQKEYVEIAQKEIDELENLEIDFPDITFTLDELDSIRLTVEQLDTFLPFIAE